MGRAVLWVAGLFITITALAAGLLSAMLSVHGSDGRSGWDAALGREAKPQSTKPPPEQTRKRDMAKMTLSGPVNPRGCPTILPGETARFTLTALEASNGADSGYLGVYVYKNGEFQGFIEISDPFPAEYNYDFTVGTESFTVLFDADITDIGIAHHPSSVSVDTTTKPSFGSCSPLATDCDPLTWSASVNIFRADSWSYKLYDSGNNEVSGGPPN